MLKKYILFSAGIAFLFASCDKKELDPVLNVGAALTLSSPASGSTIEFTESTVDNIFTTFSWTAQDYGFQAAVTYNLEVDLAGNSFSDPTSMGITTSLNLNTLKISKLNTYALNKGLPSGQASGLEFRVKATVNSDVAPVYSNVITISVNPYEAQIPTEYLQVPGNYQGWDPGNHDTEIFSKTGDSKYSGYVYFGTDNTEFKYTKGTSWDVNWGDDGADGTLDPGGANILTNTTAGMFYLQVDLNALTHSLQKRDWGLIGSATPTGWDSDTNMTWDDGKKALTITMDLVAGDIKFRANDDWAVNLGDNDADSSLEQDGSNIAIAEAGNYTIDLIITRESGLTYTVTKN